MLTFLPFYFMLTMSERYCFLYILLPNVMYFPCYYLKGESGSFAIWL